MAYQIILPSYETLGSWYKCASTHRFSQVSRECISLKHYFSAKVVLGFTRLLDHEKLRNSSAK